MAQTSFSGPVYGAVQQLIVAHIDTVATSLTSAEIYEYTVETPNDWYAMSVQGYAAGAGTAATTIDVKDDGTSILSAPITLSTGGVTSATVTADSGEVAGKRIVAGSAMTIIAATGATTAPTDITVVLVGYRRATTQP